MNPTAFAPDRRPDFFVAAQNQSVSAPCHTYTARDVSVPLDVWTGTAFSSGSGFRLDTGCDFCTVDYPFAVAHGLQLDRNCAIDVGALTGTGRAWLTKRFVRFPQLPRVRFSFHFLVPIPLSHPDHPDHDPAAPPPPPHPLLLGIADLLDAFELVVTAAGVGFYLRPGAGTPIVP